MLNNLQRLTFLKENDHYVTPNFVGYNYLLLFLTVESKKYCVVIDKKRLSYHRNQVNLKKVNIYKLLVNTTSSIFRGTIFDCKLINSVTESTQNLLITKLYLLINKRLDLRTTV